MTGLQCSSSPREKWSEGCRVFENVLSLRSSGGNGGTDPPQVPSVIHRKGRGSKALFHLVQRVTSSLQVALTKMATGSALK